MSPTAKILGLEPLGLHVLVGAYDLFTSSLVVDITLVCLGSYVKGRPRMNQVAWCTSVSRVGHGIRARKYFVPAEIIPGRCNLKYF